MAVLEVEQNISSIPKEFQESIRVIEDKSVQLSSGNGLLNSDWEVIALYGRKIADGLREETLRTELGKTKLISSCGNLLSSSGTNKTIEQKLGQTQLLRIIGNLCFDHDENRALSHVAVLPSLLIVLSSVLGLNSPNESIRHLLSIDELTLIRASVGALLNMSLKYDPVREDLMKPETLRILLALVDSRSSSQKSTLPIYLVGSWASTSLEGRADWEKRIEMGSLIMTWTINMLEDLLSEDKSFFPELGVLSLASIILTPSPVVDTLLPSPWGNEKERIDMVETDLHLLTTASSLLEALSIDLESAKQDIAFATYSSISTTTSSSPSTTSLLSHLFTFIESSSPPQHHWSTATSDPEFGVKVFSTIKSAVVRSVIEAPNSDFVMNKLFEDGKQEEGEKSWIVKQLVNWMENEIEGREDLLILGSHMLAALGRKDEYCLALVQDYGLASSLSKIVKMKAKQQFVKTDARPGEVTQILFGVVSLLRHLAIPTANKELLGEGDIIESVSSLLVQSLDIVGPLQTAVIGLLKQLTVSNISNSVRFVTSLIPTPPSITASTSFSSILPDQTPLEYTLALIKRTDDVRLRSESTRIIVNVVRSLFSTKSFTNSSLDFASASPITPAGVIPSSSGSTLDEVEVLKRRGKPKIVRIEVIESLSEMIRLSEKYPMLINEGIVALTLLAGSGAIGALLVLDALIQIHSTVPKESPSESELALSPLSPTFPTSPTSATRTTPRRTTSLAVTPSGDPSTSLTMLVNWLNIAATTTLASSTTVTTNSSPKVVGNGIYTGMIINVCALLITVMRGGEVAKADVAKLNIVKSGIKKSLKEIEGKEGIEKGLKVIVGRALEVVESS